jgi:hypothetical protein
MNTTGGCLCGPTDPACGCGAVNPTPETPAGGLTTEERRLLADRALGGAEPSLLMILAVEQIVAARVALGPLRGPAQQQQPHIEALEAKVAAWAHVVRDHTMPPNKDSHGYDYRMGWWDSIVQADRIIQRGIRICTDCPAALTATEDGHRP